MSQERIILVTGVAGQWGSRVAASLMQQPDVRVIGLDNDVPQEKYAVKGLDFVQADVRNPLLAELLKSEAVDTVCHLAFWESVRLSPAAFDFNVNGAFKLIGACLEAGVRKVVIKSSTSVYGAHPDNSTFLTEAHALRGSRQYGASRDLVEIETFCSGLRHRVPQLELITLRFAHIVGPTVDTPMMRFLKEAWAPSLLGFDPMMQVIHEDDVTAALLHAIRQPMTGAFNVAAEGVLPFSKLMALAGKLALPAFHPLCYWASRLPDLARHPLARYFPLEPDYLRYTCVGDLDAMRRQMNFAPQHKAEQALRQLTGLLRLGRYRATALAQDEAHLRETLERRARDRQEPASATPQE